MINLQVKKPGFAERTRLLMALLALAFSALACAAPAQAHGGGTPQLVQTPSGPYQLYTWTNPDPARVGTLHVTVALVAPATQQPVLNADVQIQALQANQESQPITTSATHANAVIKTYYEADLELPDAGPWQITVAHSDAAGSGSASFALDVQPAARNWRSFGVAAVLAVIALGAWFMLRNPQVPGTSNHPDVDQVPSTLA